MQKIDFANNINIFQRLRESSDSLKIPSIKSPKLMQISPHFALPKIRKHSHNAKE